jgi:uncharacterized membrane protein YeiH
MDEFQVPFIFDYVATFAWATTGSIVGVRKGYDLTGVIFVAVISSTGGGLLRDGLFLHRFPPVLVDPVYLPLIGSAVLFVVLFGRYIHQPRNRKVIDNVVLAIDAIGVPAFAVVGMQLALAKGVPLPGVLLIGVINGTGGGLLRDVLINETPAVLLPGQYFGIMLFVGTGLYLAATQAFGWPARFVGWGMVALFFLSRLVVMRFNLRTRPISP